MNWRDLLERAVWTAIQGAIAAVSVEAVLSGDPQAIHAALVGGGAAVLSMLKTVAKDRLAKLKVSVDAGDAR